MDKDVYEVADSVKLNWMKRDLCSIIRISAVNYRELLRDSDFRHEKFMETGGFVHLEAYKRILNSLKETESPGWYGVNIDECLSYATQIESIYNKRWETKQ